MYVFISQEAKFTWYGISNNSSSVFRYKIDKERAVDLFCIERLRSMVRAESK